MTCGHTHAEDIECLEGGFVSRIIYFVKHNGPVERYAQYMSCKRMSDWLYEDSARIEERVVGDQIAVAMKPKRLENGCAQAP